MSMTKEEAILLSAYTGYLLVPDFSELHKFCEETLGRPIFTHEFADQDVQKELQDKLRPQLLEMIQNIFTIHPITREQVEKVWRGEWKAAVDMGIAKIYECSVCHTKKADYSSFCPNCGAPMTDEAVDMVMERLEALHSETKTD